MSSLYEIVPLTIIKAGRALKFFPFIIIFLYFKLLKKYCKSFELDVAINCAVKNEKSLHTLI